MSRHEPVSTRDASHGEVAAGLGAAVRRCRLEAGLSITALAELTELTQPFISQLEHGKTVPSLTTLYRMASALGVTPQELLAGIDPGQGGVRAVPAGQGPHYPMSDEPGSVARLLVARAHLGLEVVEYELESGFRTEGWFEHGGTDFVYVLRGGLLVEIGDGRTERVKAGDALEYPGIVPHRWSAIGLRPVKLLLVGIAHN